MIRPLVGAVLLCAIARADEPSPPPLPSLFARRAEVQVATPGLQALEVPLEIVRACRPGLADLRLWSTDREVPYLLDTTGPDPWTLAERIDVRPGKIREDDRSPFCDPAQRDAFTHCELIELAGPPRGGAWELVFDAAAPRFVERVLVAARRGDRLQPIVREEAIYRLPGGPPDRVRVPLPDAAVGAQLVVVLRGDRAPLAPRLRLERGEVVRGADTLEAPLEVAREWRDREGTHVVLERPRGLLPTALEVRTTTGAFDRAVRVFDVGGGAARPLVGEGRIARLALPAAGTRVAIDQVQVAVGVPRGRRLEVVIDDGDSPRLDALAVRAILRRPVLVFDQASPASIELYYGGGRAEAPRYDLQGLLPAEVAGEGADGVRAQIAARLRARDGVAKPALGPSAANPRFDATPALATVAHAGAAIDLSVYSHARALAIAPSPDGLSRYVLQAEDLAVARPDLGDLRVVDAQGRQWPYLIDQDVYPAVVALPRPRATSRDGRTRYALALPSAPLEAGRLDLDVAERFFDRAVVLVGHDAGGREQRYDARISRKLGEHTPVRIAAPLGRVSALELEIVDGGDAPLTIEGGRLLVPTAALDLAATAGAYRLVAGDPEAEAPRYELRALDELIGQLDAAAVRTGPLGPNPTFSRAARLRSGGARERALVWIVLGVAVVVLGLLTLKMARAEEPRA